MVRVLIFLFLWNFSPSHLEAADNLCRAEDASDRVYLERVLALIREARESVDVSMFAINMQPSPTDPATQLVEALKSAAQSGKKVRLWLNSRQASIGTNRIFMRPDLQNDLLRTGIRIFYVDKKFRLHDKLIVIDGEIVVDGSMNWTREALLKNFESVTILHSQTLAAQKIKRLESMPAAEQAENKAATRPEDFLFPLNTLRDPKVFPAAMEGSQLRTLNLYLLLLDHAHRTKENSFVIDLEVWGERLPFKKRWIGRSLRHEMRRTLKFLESYSLVTWEMAGAREARVTLRPAGSSEEILIPAALIEAGYVKSLSSRSLFIYLIALYKAQIFGSVPFWLGPIGEVAPEFHLNPVTLIRGLWDLRRKNLIEIYPSEKKLVNGVWQREFTNRYMINPIEGPEKRESQFNALEKKYGEKLVSKARELADSIDEPEDPAVTREILHLLKHYPEKEVEEATGIVAGFNRNNALRTPAYIRGILAAEVK